MASTTGRQRTGCTNVRQDVFPLDQWTITTRKGIIMQSKCTCKGANQQKPNRPPSPLESDNTAGNNPADLCDICRYHFYLPHLHTMPDMLFNNNQFRLEHASGVGIEFNPLDALRQVEETTDPLKVAVADGWQSARADCPFAKHISRPFDWTFTTDYRGTLLSAINKSNKTAVTSMSLRNEDIKDTLNNDHEEEQMNRSSQVCLNDSPSISKNDTEAGADLNPERLRWKVEETDECIDVNKLKVREDILFYDDITLYEDELADHGTAQYSVKVRVMPSSLFVLARYYLRIDGVMARINDTRLYHDLKKDYILREYTNREAKLSSFNLPISIIINPSELMNHLPLIEKRCERLSYPTKAGIV